MALPVTLSDVSFLQPQPPPFEIDGRYYIVARDGSTVRETKVLRADDDDPAPRQAEPVAKGRERTLSPLHNQCSSGPMGRQGPAGISLPRPPGLDRSRAIPPKITPITKLKKMASTLPISISPSFLNLFS